MLKAFAWSHPKSWDTKLTHFEMAYNSSEHHTTGFAPFVLAYGQNINTPLSLLSGGPPPAVPAVEDFVRLQTANLAEAKEHIQRARDRYTTQANRHRRPGEFTARDLVLLALDKPTKLQPRFEGPYLILEHTSTLTYKLKLRDGDTRHPVFHISLLRLFEDGLTEFPSRANPPPNVVEMPPDHSANPLVASILTHKLGNTAFGIAPVYLVTWIDKPEYDNAWLSTSELNALNPDLFRSYVEENPDSTHLVFPNGMDPEGFPDFPVPHPPPPRRLLLTRHRG